MRPLKDLPFVFTALIVPIAASAQSTAPPTDPPPEEWDSVTDALRGHEWADQINNLLAVVDVMPDSLYSYAPREPMMSFGGVIDHIADVQYYFCDAISGRTGPERPDAEEGAGKETVVVRLMDAIDTCDLIFDEMTDTQLVADRATVADMITTMMGHTRRETGKLVTYLRLVNVTPPEIEFYKGRVWRKAP